MRFLEHVHLSSHEKDIVKAYYDRYADVYDVRHGVTGARHVYNFQRYYEPFLIENIPTGSCVLELGCGTGVYTRWLQDHGCRVVAMDISSNIIKLAQRRCPQATIILGDCENPADYLPEELTSEAFDIILGVNTFSYYPNKGPAMLCHKELLKPNGKIVLLDMNSRCPLYRMMIWTGKNEMPQWYHHIRQSNSTTLKQLTRQAGLRINRITHFAFIPNAVGSAVLNLLRPIDAVFGRLPFVRTLAMRVGLVAERG